MRRAAEQGVSDAKEVFQSSANILFADWNGRRFPFHASWMPAPLWLESVAA